MLQGQTPNDTAEDDLGGSENRPTQRLLSFCVVEYLYFEECYSWSG
jgi:hypothetical protein